MKIRSLEEKILSHAQITKISQELRSLGKKIVTSNGCFDLIHLGHISYLIEAASLGDLLIVGINSDASVKKLKGNDRPINCELTRAKQVAALESVDFVTIFNEDTPENILALIKPWIHVKGGDYLPANLPEKAVVEANGGKVICVSLVDGYSTTELIKKIK
ncbi:MAG: D-glycero-beta-D-manno-heptose 1-phosphate adenylyltransferase [Bdellovibrionales bacterium]|nr:D-glycero-beta-D-manno-heptose 1-phosphate adenylyltransferase [Bdellovibrionales bacterium]